MIHKVPKTLESPHVQVIERVVDVPVMAHRQVPSVQRAQKMLDMAEIQFIDKVVDVPHIMQQQASAAEVTQKPGTMNPKTAGQMDRSIPQISEQIVEAPRIIPQEFVL